VAILSLAGVRGRLSSMGSSATIPDSGLAWRKSCVPGAGEFQGAASQFVMRRYHDVHDEARVGRECDEIG